MNVANGRARHESWRPYLLLGLAVLAVGLAAWRPIPAGVWHDDGVYVMVGKALSEGDGLTYQGVVGAPPAVKFPPVYSVFLAGLWSLFGAIGTVTLVATMSNLLFLALAAVFLARALRESAGLPVGISLAAGGLGVVSADVLRTSSAVLSEPLFLALVAGAFALWAGTSRQDRGRQYSLALAALLLVLISTRAAGLAFVVGFGLATAIRSGPRAAALVAGPALGGWVGWSLWARSRGALISPDMADLLGPYGGWMREQFFSDPAAFVARFPAHVLGVLERVAVLLLPRLDGPILWAGATLLFGVAIYGWLDARRRFPPLAWSSLAYLGLLFVWPYLDRRLVVPLHVFVVALVAMGAVALVAGLRHHRRAAALVAGLAALWAGFYGVVNAHRIASEWPTAAYSIRANRLAAAVEAMNQTVPRDAVVGAPEFWAALHLHGGWTVAPSVLFDPASTDAESPVWGSPEAQERLWRSAGIEYLLLEQGGLLHGAALDRLEERCPGMVQVLARTPPMLVVRVDWARGPEGAPCPEI